MKKLFIVTILVAFCGTLRAQQITGEELSQIDNAVKSLAAKIATKLAKEKAQTVAIGQFVYMGGNTRFNAYLQNQLTGELTDVQGSSYSLLVYTAPEFIVSGEIVPIANVVRIYSRILNRESSAVVSQIQMDLELNQSILAMLSAGSGNDSDSITVMPDGFEPDSWETPMVYNIQDKNSEPINRSIQSGDEDWFLISPADHTQLVVETTGNTDTYIELYDADTREKLAENDDDSDNSNARVRYLAGAGKKYMVKVRGYSDTAGDYGFRAYTEEMAEPIPYEVHDDINDARFVMRTLGENGDSFLLVPDGNGVMIMETSGDNDVKMEFYDADTWTLLNEDDDSGYDFNARILFEVERGKRYIARVIGLSSDATGQYGFKAYLNRR